MRILLGVCLALTTLLATNSAHAQGTKPDASAIEAFEKEVRPILATRCQSCHGADKQKGGLRLDSRAGALAGGDSGPAIVVGKPAESRLVEAINYVDDLRMPPKSKLPAAEAAALTRWVAAGAPWPESVRPTGAADAAAKGPGLPWDRRLKHWSFQPVRRTNPPTVRAADWPVGPIDLFVLAGLENAGLKPAADASKRDWIRRVTFDLIGLPPKPEEVDAFLADTSKEAAAKVVDRLLASPHYGERWARHWLDLVRFAETSGHEFDYDIPDAWRYRDYVIRAFNADVPFDRFAIEHIAGDLLREPRRNPSNGTDESILATGFFYLGEGTHSPVDVREDEATRVDNQIDVLSKAFLGLTVACARCHDHKFDAITTRDYYALSGFLKSSRFQRTLIDPHGTIAAKVAELGGLKDQIGRGLKFDKASSKDSAGPKDDRTAVFADFSRGSLGGWTSTGPAFAASPTTGSDWRVVNGQSGAASVEVVGAGWAHSGLVSDRLQGVLRSPTFVIDRPFLQIYAKGRGGRVNVVVDGFEKIRDPIYGPLTIGVDSNDHPRWHTMNLGMWRGHRAYIELADGAMLDYTGGHTRQADGDGYLAVRQVVASESHAPPNGEPAGVEPARIVAVQDAATAAKLSRYREVEGQIPAGAFATTIVDGTGQDTRVQIRGNTRSPGDLVPRRFIEALGGHFGDR